MILRCVLLILGLGSLWMLSYCVESQLVKDLEKVAEYDTLTMLFNRRRLEYSLNEFAGQEKENGRKYSVLMCDIDNFKNVNDSYGHDCGDKVLKDVANIIRNIIGSSGLVFRYGGEEFLVLLYADEEKAAAAAEIIREAISSLLVAHNGNTISVTATVGLAQHRDGESSESLIKRADTNLYFGKNHGKNCVVR